MTEYIKVVAFPASHADEFSLTKDHPERVIINFVKADDGGPAEPMQYKVWSDRTLAEAQIREIYELLQQGAATDKLPDRTRFGWIRQFG